MKWLILLAVFLYIGMNVKVKTTHSPKDINSVVSENVEKIFDDTFSEISKNVREQANIQKHLGRK